MVCALAIVWNVLPEFARFDSIRVARNLSLGNFGLLQHNLPVAEVATGRFTAAKRVPHLLSVHES
jgi:hypothetical protein